MIPDYELAATKAMQLLRDNRINDTPVDSFSILLNYPGVRVISYTTMAAHADIERDRLIPLFGSNTDAATFRLDVRDICDTHYVVVYNLRLPYEIVWRGVARELGHIVLGHDGQTRSTEVRKAEAMCFAHHLLSPRPVINLLRNAFPITMNILCDTTGCSSECVNGLQSIPGVKTPAELNREVRDLFSKHINEYINFRKLSPNEDTSAVVDFGTFMDNYEE